VGDLCQRDLEQWTRMRSHADFHSLLRALRVPPEVRTSGGYFFTGEQALMLLLARLACTGTLAHISSRFGYAPSAISQVNHWMYEFLWDNYNARVLQGLLRWRLWLPQLSAAVATMAPANFAECFAFLDGTKAVIMQPTEGERECYNGKDRTHCMGFLTAAGPCGLALFAWGAEPGCRHDAYLLQKSGLEALLQALNAHDPYHVYFLYGDSAFPHRVHIRVRSGRPSRLPTAVVLRRELQPAPCSLRCRAARLQHPLTRNLLPGCPRLLTRAT
jgi:hypothetical protein